MNMSGGSVDVFGVEQLAVPKSKTAEQEAEDERQRQAVAQLVARRARDDQDQALLLDVLGITPGACPPPAPERCGTCGYLTRARSHKILCGP